MKRALKIIVATLLGMLARLVVLKYHPTIVMVTGSVGKTSTKDAVAAVAKSAFFARASEKSYNSEFGVPFTIFGVKNPWKNPFAWLWVLKEAFALLLLPNHYPKLLVLEVGADRPGDMLRILRIVTPDVVVATRLPDIPVHVEAYASPRAVREEEFLPAYALGPSGVLVLNADYPHQEELAKGLSARFIRYGFEERADVRMLSFDFLVERGNVTGMKGILSLRDTEIAFTIQGAVGKQHAYPVLAAAAAGEALGIPIARIREGLASYIPPPGRMRLLEGKNDSRIIDDTYNASPVATEEALTVLTSFPGAKRRIAFLGDMLELGRYSVVEHERIGTLVSKDLNLLVAVGMRARAICDAALKAGLPAERVRCFDNSKDAAREMPEVLQPGDVVLVKGSQSIRMERVTEALLKDLSETETLLVRQDKEWKRRA